MRNQFNKREQIIDEYWFSPSRKREILKTIFFNPDDISDGSFLYEWKKWSHEEGNNWSAKFNKIANDPFYKEVINWVEDSLLQSNQGFCSFVRNHIIKKKNLIELWTANWDKFIKNISYIHPELDELHGKTYIWVDISGIHVDESNKNVKEHLPMLKTEWIPWNWFEHSVFDTTTQQAYFFFWGSICNFSPEKIKELIMRLRTNTKLPTDKTSLLVTYFQSPDPKDPQYNLKKERLKAAYGDTTPWNQFSTKNTTTQEVFSDFILSGFEALGIPKEVLKYIVEYEEKTDEHPARIKLWAEFTKDFSQNIEWLDIRRNLWDKIWAIPSQRFTSDDFSHFAKQSGFTIKKEISSDGICISFLESYLLNNQKDKIQSFRNKVSKALAWVLLTATLVWWGYVLSKQNERNKANQFLKEKLTSKDISRDFDWNQILVNNVQEKQAILEDINKEVYNILETIYPRFPSSEKNRFLQIFQWWLYNKQQLIYRFPEKWHLSQQLNLKHSFEYLNEFINDNEGFFISNNYFKKYSDLEEYEESFMEAISQWNLFFNITDKSFAWYYTIDGRFFKDKIDILDYFLQTRPNIQPIQDRFLNTFCNVSWWWKRYVIYPELYPTDYKKYHSDYILLLKDIVTNKIDKKDFSAFPSEIDKYLYDFSKRNTLVSESQYVKYKRYIENSKKWDNIFGSHDKFVESYDEGFWIWWGVEKIGEYSFGDSFNCYIWIFTNILWEKILVATNPNEPWDLSNYSFYRWSQVFDDFMSVQEKFK